MWFNDPTEYTSTTCDCAVHAGREVRIWNGVKARDAILASPDATHNAATGAARLPFAYTANSGVVLADRITRP